MNIENRIEEARINKGLTQVQFAKLMGLTSNSINIWEKGKSLPSMSNLLKIAKILEVSFGWLGTGEGEVIIEVISLSNKEQEFVNLMRQMPKQKQQALLAFLQSGS